MTVTVRDTLHPRRDMTAVLVRDMGAALVPSALVPSAAGTGETWRAGQAGPASRGGRGELGDATGG
jgi:hypothetical protein